MSERWPQFDVENDSSLIAAGTHFYCHAHLTAHPITEKSPDPRYCHECYQFLEAEARQLTGKPSWLPKALKEHDSGVKVSEDAGTIMHTSNGAKKQSVHNSVPEPQNKPSKRGPKFRGDLPQDLIRQWAGEGMGAKAISYRLKRELGIRVHYSTIQRLLAR